MDGPENSEEITDWLSGLRSRRLSRTAEEAPEEDSEDSEEEDVQDASTQEATPSSGRLSQVYSGAPVGVLVRCRPLKEGSAMEITATQKGLKVELRLGERNKEGRLFRCNGYVDENGGQEEVFQHCSPVVDRVMEGYNGVVFCYGITGSGKTHTMSGPPREPLAKQVLEPLAPELVAAQQGVVQRAAKRIFEFIRDKTEQGQVFTVEASFVEIYSPDGVRENLIDLLAAKSDDAKLELKQDPLVGRGAFMVEGLKTVPIRSPDEMRQVLEGGRRRCVYMETSRNCVSSRSHCLFTVVIECLVNPEDPKSDVRRGKLVLVDLAGSESLKKVMALKGQDEELRRKQAIGINRVLSHLGAVVNNLNAGFESTGVRNSALTMLLRDCLGGGARALLIANIGPEKDWQSETFMTLRFAQKMMKVKNVEQQVVIDATQSNLMVMKKRHEACLARLKQKVEEEADEDSEERAALDKEIEELNERLLTRESATDILEKMHQEQARKMEQFRTEVTENMARQFADIQETSQKQIEGLKQVIESKAREEAILMEQQQQEDREARLGALEAEILSVEALSSAARRDAAELQLRLAAAQQRAETLQELQSDVAKQRADMEQERRELKQKAEEQGGRLAQMERDMDRFRVEADVRSEEKKRLEAAHAADLAAAEEERQEWRGLEASLQSAVDSLRSELSRPSHHEALADDAELTALQQRRSELEAQTRAQERELDLQNTKKTYAEMELESFRQSQGNLRLETEMKMNDLESLIMESKQNAKDLQLMLQQVYENIAAADRRKKSKASR